MSFCRCLIIFFIFKIGVIGLERDTYIVDNNDLGENGVINNDYYYYKYAFNPRKIKSYESEIVSIQLYYECLCPDCIKFDTTSFAPVVKKLSSYLNIQTYPYGNAKTYRRNGQYQFICQHGPEECYGNKLHACAIDILQDKTQAVLFNSCMMVPRNGNHGSTDEAADAYKAGSEVTELVKEHPTSLILGELFCQQCGAEQNVDSAPIKECAKGARGIELLKYYGDESKTANFTYVPHILINGQPNDGSNFMKDVCAAFINPPPPCLENTNGNYRGWNNAM